MIYDFEKGLTVAEFKKLIADWPETDIDGEPTEVWISTGVNLSSPVVEVSQLNRTDLILSCDDEAWSK